MFPLLVETRIIIRSEHRITRHQRLNLPPVVVVVMFHQKRYRSCVLFGEVSGVPRVIEFREDVLHRGEEPSGIFFLDGDHLGEVKRGVLLNYYY